jgi:hypothetical protein
MTGTPLTVHISVEQLFGCADAVDFPAASCAHTKFPWSDKAPPAKSLVEMSRLPMPPAKKRLDHSMATLTAILSRALDTLTVRLLLSGKRFFRKSFTLPDHA